MASLYLAGPLFTYAERHWNHGLATGLVNAGHQVWLPQEMAGLALKGDELNPNMIFESAINGISAANIVIAILDGPDPDSGTAFECGYAYALNIPVIGVRTDFRRGGDDQEANVNLMLAQGVTHMITITSPATDNNSPALTEKICAIIDSLPSV